MAGLINETLQKDLMKLGYYKFNLAHRAYIDRPWCCFCKSSIIVGWKHSKVWYHEDCLLKSKTVKKRLEMLRKGGLNGKDQKV